MRRKARSLDVVKKHTRDDTVGICKICLRFSKAMSSREFLERLIWQYI